MSAQFVTTEVTRFDAAGNIFVPETKFTAVEVCFELRLNGKKFRQIFCSPVDLEDLTIGVLAQAGKISSADDVTRLDIDAANFAIDVATSTVDKLSANDIDAANFAIDVATSAVDKLSADDVDAANFAIDVATSAVDKLSADDVDAANFAIDVATSTVDKLSANDIDAANFAIDVATSTVDKLSANDVDAANFAIDVATSAVDKLSADDVDAANFAIDVATSTVDKLSANDVDAANFAIDVATSAVDELCDVQFSAKKILACADKLLGELSPTHAKTNGVHGGLLFDGEKILLVREDIGRHNVFDKIHGAALRQRINLRDKVLIFSGRCSAEMMLKLHRMKIPVVAAKSVPTTESIALARKFGITLAARMSAGSFCIYTNPQRIVL